MGKFDLKGKLTDAANKATQLTEEAVKAAKETDYKELAKQSIEKAKNIDLEETAKQAGDHLNSIANTVRSTTKEDIKQGAINMAVNGSQAAMHYATDAFTTTRDAKNALNELNSVQDNYISIDAALTSMYLLMYADQTKTLDEEKTLREIATENNIDNEVVVSVENQVNKIIESAKEDGDYVDYLLEQLNQVLTNGFAQDGTNRKLLLWDLLTIAKIDGDYSEDERRLLNSASRALKVDKAVLKEMELAYDAMMAIGDTNDKRIEVIMNSVRELIDDQEVA